MSPRRALGTVYLIVPRFPIIRSLRPVDVVVDLFRSRGIQVYSWVDEFRRRGLDPGNLDQADPEDIAEAYEACIDRLSRSSWVVFWPEVEKCPVARASVEIANAFHVPVLALSALVSSVGLKTRSTKAA